MSVFAVLLAAGESRRFDGAGNKLLQRLPGGRRVWEASFDALRNHPKVDGVGIVGSDESFAKANADFVVPGGATRCESSLIGVRQAPSGALVLVHDAARPWASQQLISTVIEGAKQSGACVPVVPVIDTLKSVEDGVVGRTVDRSKLYCAQTPQAAIREPLLEALFASPDATDEASALEFAGITVAAVPGEPANKKVTTRGDLPQGLLISSTGTGFDIHAFSADPNRKLMLGGVHFKGSRGLEGHSDADVLLHALTDALLGAIGGGDIGVLFPNTDPANKNVDSMTFVRRARDLVCDAGGSIVSIDLTLLAEAPKLGEKRAEIRKRISQELGLSERRINIKATTMEGLGAIGRSEGIAAMAAATVALPISYHEE